MKVRKLKKAVSKKLKHIARPRLTITFVESNDGSVKELLQTWANLVRGT